MLDRIETTISSANAFFNRKQYELSYKTYQDALDLLHTYDTLPLDREYLQFYCYLGQLESRVSCSAIPITEFKDEFNQLQNKYLQIQPSDALKNHLNSKSLQLSKDIDDTTKRLTNGIKKLDENINAQITYMLDHTTYISNLISKIPVSNQDEMQTLQISLAAKMASLNFEHKENLLKVIDDNIETIKNYEAFQCDHLSRIPLKRNRVFSLQQSLYKNKGDIYFGLFKSANEVEKFIFLQNAKRAYEEAINILKSHSDSNKHTLSQYARAAIPLCFSILKIYSELLILISDASENLHYLDCIADYIKNSNLEKTIHYLNSSHQDRCERNKAYIELNLCYQKLADHYSNLAKYSSLANKKIVLFNKASRYYEYVLVISDVIISTEKNADTNFDSSYLKKLEVLSELISVDKENKHTYVNEANDFVKNYKILKRINDIKNETERNEIRAKLSSFDFITSETLQANPSKKRKINHNEELDLQNAAFSLLILKKDDQLPELTEFIGGLANKIKTDPCEDSAQLKIKRDSQSDHLTHSVFAQPPNLLQESSPLSIASFGSKKNYR